MNPIQTKVALLLVIASGLVWADTRIPAPYSTANPRVTAATPRAEFEGPNSGDYLNTINNFSNPNANILANPSMAAGPDELVMVVNSQIWRLPNGNAPGVVPNGLNPGSALVAGEPYGAQRAFLDNWMGEAALAVLCPTGNSSMAAGVVDPGNTRNAVTCQIDNASVVYDQMQGRFLVLFTVVDTGLTFNNVSQSYVLTRPRKASWVLVVSRFAVLVDQACFQLTEPTGCPAANTTGSFAFVTPTPVGAGGINTAIWGIYYGNALGTGAADGFGSNKAAAGAWAGTVGFGNINAIPGIGNAVGSARNTTTPFDCTPAAIAASGTVPGTVCYLPTTARLGVDNDTITIASPVINANINSANLGAVYNPFAGTAFQLPAYAGTRLRVIKKTALYTFSPLVAGDQFNAALANRTAGSSYDLYTSPTNDGAPVDNTSGGGPPIVFTAILNNVLCVSGSVPGGFSGGLQGSLISSCRFTPLFYEPAHLRGRALASYSNLPVGQNSQTYLLGAEALGPGIPNQVVWLQGVREIYTGGDPSNQFGPLPFYPTLQALTNTGDFGATGLDQRGFPTSFATPAAGPQLLNADCSATMDPVTCAYNGLNPLPQQTFRSGAAAPNLYVGDQRPHKLIFREGRLYDARVVGTIGQTIVAVAAEVLPTVVYDIAQKLNAGAVPTNVYNQLLPDRNGYAPMFDVPANVVNFREGAPFNAARFVEKLFAATTTTPPLFILPDTSYSVAPPGTPAVLLPDFVGGDPRSRETFGAQGLPATQLPFQANCFAYPIARPVGDAPRSWASLTDMRCGQDATDSTPQIRNPYTGLVASTAAFTIRGDESIDPNDGSLWNLGAYAQKRDSSGNVLAHWGTFGANFKFPVTDAFGNSTAVLNGIVNDTAGNPRPEFPYIQMALNLGFTPVLANGAINSANGVITPGSAVITNLPVEFTSAVAVGQPVSGEGIPAGSIIIAKDATTITFGLNPANALAPGDSTLVTAYAGAAVLPGTVAIPFAGVNSLLYGTVPGAVPIPGGMTPPGNAPAAGTFGTDDAITRREMAYWIVRSQMDDTAIIQYLQNSQARHGGPGLAGISFLDVPRNDPGWPYVEVMARRGYTGGCGQNRFCPDIVANRRDLAAYMIRAKEGNVFASVLSGCAFSVDTTTPPTSTIFPPAITSICDAGDNFGLFVTGLPYFTDNLPVIVNDWYVFIQKMRELRVTNGTSLGPNTDGRNGTYSPGTSVAVVAPNDPGALLRKQVAVFMIRGFFF
jgi:hypothetical protein